MRSPWCGAIVVGLAAGPLTAQTSGASEGAVTVPSTRVHDLHSERAGRDFQLWVAEPVPGAFPFPPGPRAVLWVLDANLFFGTAVELTRLMSQLFGELPPLLVVGVAYDTDEPAVQAELRARDFTPTAESGLGEPPSMPGAPEPMLPAGERLGGAAAFLDFLEHEAVPFIAATYDVAPGESTLFGSSLGGLFALHAFLERPRLFSSYIATSPAIWWGDGHLLRRERALAESTDDVSASLVLAVGGLEESPDIPMLGRFKMVTNVREMADQLRSRAYPSLSLTTLVLEGESHTSVAPVALTRGLRVLYGRGLRP